jgi:hypothetical protein
VEGSKDILHDEDLHQGKWFYKGLSTKDVFLGGGGLKVCSLCGRREDKRCKTSKGEGVEPLQTNVAGRTL